jgi:hypothetical protein
VAYNSEVKQEQINVEKSDQDAALNNWSDFEENSVG